MEIGVAVEISVGLGFLFTGLTGGGVFQGFRGSGWLAVEVEISVVVGLGFVFTNLGLGEFGFMFVGFYLFIYLCGFVCLFLGFFGFDLLEVYGFDFLDLLSLIWGRT